MIKVGFWYDEGLNYSGGLNYYFNLIYAFASLKQSKYEIIFFFPSDLASYTEKRFSPYCKIIKINVLKNKSINSLLNKIIYRLTGINSYLEFYFWKFKIDIYSHSKSISKKKFINFKIINWIPDFQYIYLKKLFDKTSFKILDDNTKNILKYCDHLILSSNNAYSHLKENYYDFYISHKVSVLNFVSQVNPNQFTDNDVVVNLIKKKFFYLPNQFWSHKNHLVAFKAINELKSKYKDILLVCTGNPYDYKNNTRNYFELLNQFIVNNNLEKNIINLGMVSYDDVNVLIKNCLAVINPSLFEGWSSTVEEAKSFNKYIILSNIEIHKEQNPNQGIYFEKENYKQLAKILIKLWHIKDLKKINFSNQKNRTLKFGKNYYAILEIVNNLKLN